METIQKINLIEDDGAYDGYEIVTNEKTISLLIENHQDCCELWGYFWCNDNPEEFIGSELIDIKVVDDALNQQLFDETVTLYEGNVMFVNLETSFGTLQFVAYNEHNGYYGHTAMVRSESFNYETFL